MDIKVKKCVRCLNEKDAIEFTRGTWKVCRECYNEHALLYSHKVKHRYTEKVNERSMAYYNKHKDEINQKLKANRNLFSDEQKLNIKKKRKEYYEKNKERLLASQKEYLLKNKELVAERCRIKLAKNKLNPIYVIKRRSICSIGKAIKRCGYKKNSHTTTLLGIEYDLLKIYIEKQFKKGMTWENHGEWHIDHIMPIASAKNKEELMKLFHYSNLRPLWAKENRIKGSKIIEHQLKMVI